MDTLVDSDSSSTMRTIASSDGTRIVLSFGPSAPLPPRASLTRESSSIESMDVHVSRNVSEMSLPMIVVENFDGEKLESWAGGGIPRASGTGLALQQTSAPPGFCG